MCRVSLLPIGSILLTVLAAGAPAGDAVRGPWTPTAARKQPLPSRPAELVAELGCAACHAGMPGATLVPQRAPSLGDAGLRYRRSYLLAYLQSPTDVRRHIGRSRMPGFHLDERESLALALFLGSRTTPLARDRRYPAEVRSSETPRGAQRVGERLVRDELGCLGCHAVGGAGENTALDLARVGERLSGEWIRRYLVDPAALEPGTPMPALFYERDAAGGGYGARVPDAARRLVAVAAYLVSLGEDARRRQDRAFDDATRRYPAITADIGARVFRALNCAGCHEEGEGSGVAVGPSLAAVGQRLRPEWLRRFLVAPRAVRPFGFQPGSGSRMPDFRLTTAEAESVATYLESLSSGTRGFDDFVPTSFSAFSRTKAEGLLERRLPCLGCHRLDGEGGRIGPDLSAVAERLDPAYVAAVIRDPGRATQGGVMPHTPMPDGRVRLLASYLLAPRPTSADTASYLSLIEARPHAGPADTSGAGLYARYCTMCHGETGGGDGYNARFLPVPPTRHADSAYMSTRPDDTLFDGVHAGGYILNRDHRMPGFGHTLSASAIGRIVGHLRMLCGCVGPPWSRDDTGGAQ